MRAPSAGPETLERLLRRGADALEAAGVEGPLLEAEHLLAAALGTDRGGLLVRRGERVDARRRSRYLSWILRRARREPLQYVLGAWEFCGLELAVDRRALIPRPETEGLVDLALGLELPPGAAVADLGTGGGCIAVTLAVRRPDLVVHALDASAEALALARENARRHRVASRIRFVRADLAAPPPAWRGAMALVVANPPYVTDAEWETLEPEVRDHEPRAALVAGPTGLEAHRVVARAGRELLRPGGWILLEAGAGQAARVRGLLEAEGLRGGRVLEDLRGFERFVVARRPAGGPRW